MLKRIRPLLLTILILSIVTGSAIFQAVLYENRPYSKDEIDGNIGKIAYDYVKNKEYRIIDCKSVYYLLNNDTNTDKIVDLSILNIDVSSYFNKNIKEYDFQIMKHIWSKPFDICIVAIDEKILGSYYFEKNYGNYGYYTKLYSLDGKYFKGVTDDEYLKLVTDYKQKWEEYITGGTP